MPPDRFPMERYIPLALLGDSTRATVLLCRDKQRGTKVAVKCFKKLPPALRSTFESEVRKNKELNHTSIAKVVDFGFYQDKSPYLVTEYKDGFNLEQCLAMYGTPSIDVAIKILLGVCEALLYAQKQAVMHRDIRPRNIIFLDDMNSEPSVAVLDFAMPKIKAAEELTDAYDAFYMSADEARRLEYTEKSEVYSLGCIGFALLTGRGPFQDGTALDIKNSHALKLPPRISDLNFDNKRPKELEEIFEKCLEKDPRYRFDTVTAFQERLQVFPRREQLRIAGILAARTRKKVLIIVGAIVAVAAVCASVFLLFGHH
jgi:serine/threonine protein kinase